MLVMPMTLHTYLYCTNDPINYVDPMGLFRFGRRDLDNSLPYSRYFIRPLGILGGMLNIGYYHEAGFFQDGTGEYVSFYDGRTEDPDEYHLSPFVYDDDIIRQAQKNVDATGDFDEEDYGYFNNCQDYVSALRKEYKKLGGEIDYDPFDRRDGMKKKK